MYGLMNCRLSTICGARDLGKSAVAVAVSHYLAVRRHFPNGIVYVKVHSKTTVDQVQSVMVRALWTSIPEHTLHTSAASTPSSTHPAPGAFATIRDALADPQAYLVSCLRSRHMLLVLDHCDGVVSGDPGFRYFLGQLLDDVRRDGCHASSPSSSFIF